MDKRKTIKNATKPMTITIDRLHIKKAKCGDPAACVVAQALTDRFGDLFTGCEVGSNVTKIVTETQVIRYSTPNALRRAIPIFDKTGQWELPPGDYTLMPYKPRPRRWEKAKRNGGKQSVFKGRAVPSRRVKRVEALCAVDA